MAEILQRTIPYDVFSPRPLPGIQPLGAKDWLLVDDAYAAQIARREDLIFNQREQVIYQDELAQRAVDELLMAVLEELASRSHGDFEVETDQVRRPDGVKVAIDRDDPLGTLGQLVQEDLCILQKQGEEHVLTAAVLCFPASWRLADKAGRPLIAIHQPVESYDRDLARRVQRLFDGVRPGRPMWRFNALWYNDPELHQPRSTGERMVVDRNAGTCDYLRSERQTILRLPGCDAVVFSIHSFVVKAQRLLLL